MTASTFRGETYSSEATEKQRDYIRSLISERDIEPLIAPGTALSDVLDQIDGLTKSAASKWIERLKELPRKAGAQTAAPGNFPDVPAGRYAVVHEDTLKFYRVDRPDHGRWEGYTFLSVQASGEFYAIKRTSSKQEILGLIAEDPKAASQRYGHELGQCGVCGRTLTNEESRALGIGPVCAEKQGWF